MNILIKNIQALMNDEKETFVIKNVSLVIKGDTISKIIYDEVKDPSVLGTTFDKIIDGANKLVIPGFINCHTHSYMAFMRNIMDDVPFMDWLFKGVMPIEDNIMTEEDTYYGALLGMAEMIHSGTTCFNDMNVQINTAPKAAIAAGMRGFVSRGLVGEGDNQAGSDRLKWAFEEMDNFPNEELVGFMLAPHAPYTCDLEYMKIVSAKAKERGVGIHTHLSESLSEIEQIKEKYNMTPIEMAEAGGLFDGLCVAAHCVQVTDSDIDIFAKHGVSVATNPVSNMKLGNGFAPVEKMLEKGVNVCLGTDGAASNNSLNFFHEMNILSLIHKGVEKKADAMSAKTVLKIATINGAKALGIDSKVGSISEGKKADLAILDSTALSLTPHNNLIGSLVYSANGTEVETVLINGQIVMENKQILTFNEDEVKAKCEEISKRVLKELGR